MSFWKNSEGSVVIGDTQLAFAPEINNVIIPNGTKALAVIKKFDLIEKFNPQFYDAPFYEVTYQLKDGEYKDQEVKQKIKCFDRKSKTKDRALEMMMLLFKIGGVQPTQQSPTVFDLLPFVGKVIGIKIREWQKNGKEGNFVSECHPATGFVSEIGKKLPPKSDAPKENSYGNDFAAYESVADKDEGIPF